MRKLCTRFGALLVLCGLVAACDSSPSTPAASSGTATATVGKAGAAGGGAAPKHVGEL